MFTFSSTNNFNIKKPTGVFLVGPKLKKTNPVKLPLFQLLCALVYHQSF